MGFLCAVIGTLKFPDGGRSVWETLPLEASHFEDWLDNGLFSGESANRWHTVGELVEATFSLGSQGGSAFIEIEGTGEVSLQAWLPEDDFGEWHQDLATASRAAWDAGARGTVDFLVIGLPRAVQVSLDDDGSGIEWVESAEVFANDHHARVFMQLQAWHEARLADPGLRRGTYLEHERTFGLAEEVTVAQQDALNAACALEDVALRAALADEMILAPSLAPLSEVFASPAEVRDALAQAGLLPRVIAIQLVAHANAAAAEPLALRLLTDSSAHVRRSALRALARCESETAIATLLGFVAKPGMERFTAIQSLSNSKSAHVDSALLARLDGPPFDPSRYQALQPGCEPSGEALAQASTLLDEATATLQIVGQRSLHTALPQLLVMFEHPQLLALRESVVATLAQLGGPEVDARAEQLQMCMLGMGLALNQDWQRRAAILGIRPSKDADAVSHFKNLPVEGIAQLLNERFLHPDARQNDAPSASEFFAFLQEWPEAKAHGYAVGHNRPDYRITLEGLQCDLSKVRNKRRRTELREAFTSLCEEATDLQTEGDQLWAWWS